MRTKLTANGVVAMTPEEEAEFDALDAAYIASQPLRIVENTYANTSHTLRQQFSDIERATLIAIYTEIRLFELAQLTGQSAGVTTPMINAIKAQVFPGQTKAQIAATFESRVQTFLENAAVALANKMKDGG